MAVQDRQVKGWTVVNLGLMPYDILVIVGLSDKDCDKVARKFGLQSDLLHEERKTVHGRYVWAEGANCPVIRVYKPLTAQTQWTLAHEAFHAISAILRKSGIPLSEDTDECYAYALGHVVQQVNTKLRAVRAKS